MRVWEGLTDSPSWWTALGEARGTLVFDIGANVGQCARLFSDHFSQVVCYEPCDEAYEHLAADHPANVTALHLAVSDHSGYVELAVNAKSIETGQLTSGVPAEEGMGWGEILDWRTVPCTTVDEQVERFGTPDAVKVDTEGHEMAVLAGAMRLIARGSTAWYLEMHARRYEGCVRSLFDGYRITTVDHDFAPAPWDNYYMRILPE